MLSAFFLCQLLTVLGKPPDEYHMSINLHTNSLSGISDRPEVTYILVEVDLKDTHMQVRNGRRLNGAEDGYRRGSFCYR